MSKPEATGSDWVSEREYSRIHSIPRQTLANWRYRDRLAGRSFALAGYPQYQRFGRCIRYRLDSLLATKG